MAVVVLIIIGATLIVLGGGTCTACYCFKRRRKRHIEKIYETVTTYHPVYDPVATTEDDNIEKATNLHDCDEDDKDINEGKGEAPDEIVQKINVAASPHDILYEETLPLKLDKWTMQ